MIISLTAYHAANAHETSRPSRADSKWQCPAKTMPRARKVRHIQDDYRLSSRIFDARAIASRQCAVSHFGLLYVDIAEANSLCHGFLYLYLPLDEPRSRCRQDGVIYGSFLKWSKAQRPPGPRRLFSAANASAAARALAWRIVRGHTTIAAASQQGRASTRRRARSYRNMRASAYDEERRTESIIATVSHASFLAAHPYPRRRYHRHL